MVMRDLLGHDLTLSTDRLLVLSRDTGPNRPPMSLAPRTGHTIPNSGIRFDCRNDANMGVNVKTLHKEKRSF